MQKPDIGKVAPAFTTLNEKGEKVALKDFRGKKVVLYFYPKAMTPGCTSQACGLRDTKKELEKHNTIALGISPDAPSRLMKFIERDNLNFSLLSDEDHKIAEKYGVWGLKKFMGKEYDGIHRTTFIIDEDGKLINIMDKFKTKTHHEDVLAYLESL
ncbi:thioredoxin-dependent thiol peroxidase [Bermanella marisrubri]|uniref:thioredoxin-dependent peroxiredoxin n=1 Tax=Bermanella marisrubri TaxID=207949 RepID=Q1N5W6_9GAMM|nr:thioredoxin-dependent thiol peroxidase [Bermanella marisrubri]EAT13826.1 bacterioferritin comigratory protein [Oceanobacter sp. RED65] [Bermanella marisrubri]QIZ84590.1 thioredoxin-dependent thiol peroxidase [Bermanella marisrubri]